jgi:hypothetical protein
MANRDPWDMTDSNLLPFSWVQKIGSMAWDLEPGQTLSATVDDNDNISMNIK